MNEKLNKISQLVSEHEFTFDVTDDYKCGICNGIMNNAHQTICGCNFCLGCINQFIENGGANCPSCQYKDVLEISKNHRMNIQISKITVRCPNENCDHECKLIEMDGHLRLCSTGSVEFPINDNGSHLKEMSKDKLDNDFISNIEGHNKILFELIGQLRNELKENNMGKDESIESLRNDMRELKKEEAKNQLQIKMLITNDMRKDELIKSLRNGVKDMKINDMKKDDTIESLRNEIDAIKQENQELKTLMKNSNNNLWIKLDQMDIAINKRCRNATVNSINTKTESMSIDKSELEQQIINIDRKCQELNGSVQIIHQVKADSDKMIKEMQLMKGERDRMAREIERINKFLKMRHGGSLLWPIGKINEMKMIGSEMFFDFQNPYKMQLWLINALDNLKFQLLIYSGAFDEDLQWPMKARINIKIMSLNDDSQPSKSLTQSCTIIKPANDSYKESVEFSFACADLNKWHNNNCSLICSVKFE